MVPDTFRNTGFRLPRGAEVQSNRDFRYGHTGENHLGKNLGVNLEVVTVNGYLIKHRPFVESEDWRDGSYPFAQQDCDTSSSRTSIETTDAIILRPTTPVSDTENRIRTAPGFGNTQLTVIQYQRGGRSGQRQGTPAVLREKH